MKNLYTLIFALFSITFFSQTVTTLAGSVNGGYQDGFGSNALMREPFGICSDNNGNLFFTDSNNWKIRKMLISTGEVTTFAGSTSGLLDGIGLTSKFNSPFGICSDNNGNLYVSDLGSSNIRKIVIATGLVSTVAGSGSGLQDGTVITAKFNKPCGLSIDASGNNLYVADFDNYRIRKIDLVTGIVSTFANLSDRPQGVCLDLSNIYVATGNGAVLKIPINTGVVTVIAQVPPNASGICIYNGYLYVSTLLTIRQINISSASTSILAGTTGASGSADGIGTNATFRYVWGLCVAGNEIYVVEDANNLIRKVTIPLQNLSTTQQIELSNKTLIYPNPNNGKFTVNSNNELVNQVKIFSLDGKLIFSKNTNTVNPEISLESISKGIYLATITLENGLETKSKIIIK